MSKKNDDCMEERPGWYNGQFLDEVGFCADFLCMYHQNALSESDITDCHVPEAKQASDIMPESSWLQTVSFTIKKYGSTTNT